MKADRAAMRPCISTHDLYPKRPQLVAWMEPDQIVDVENDGQIVARIEPVSGDRRTRGRKKLKPGKRAQP